MKSLVIYYSYTGSTKKLAEDLATKENAHITEVKYVKRPSTLGAYISGSLAARGQKEAKLQEFDSDFSGYEKIIIAMPVWAGFPAPPFNNIMKSLPSGIEVEIIMTSGGGSSGKTKELIEATLKEKGCRLVNFQDVKASDIK